MPTANPGPKGNSCSTADPRMKYLFAGMPILFAVFIVNQAFPVGLMLYWITTNLWTVGQAAVIRHIFPPPAFVEMQAAKKRGEQDPEFQQIQLSYRDFKYRDDPDGVKCPVTSHLRRVNTRDYLDPLAASPDPKKWGGSILNNRRRILRRGLPYGPLTPADAKPGDEQGVVILAHCASLFRQFEFDGPSSRNQDRFFVLDNGIGESQVPFHGLAFELVDR